MLLLYKTEFNSRTSRGRYQLNLTLPYSRGAASESIGINVAVWLKPRARQNHPVVNKLHKEETLNILISWLMTFSFADKRAP